MAASGIVFTHYDPEKELRLATDASAYGLGCVLSHVMPDGSERATAFASRTLNDDCLLYTSPSPRDLSTSRMPSSA